MLETIIGGKSIVDIRKLYIPDIEAAKDFIRAYGFEPENEIDSETIRNIREHALKFINEVLLPHQGIDQTPAKYSDLTIEEYLLEASKFDCKAWPNWPCIVLKAIHCAAHVLYTHDSEAHAVALATIKDRFLPFISEEDGEICIGDKESRIHLIAFNIKDQKVFNRTMTKLLHKPGNLASEIVDRLGVRFVVQDVASVVPLIEFLCSRNIIMYANNLPERTKNSLSEYDQLLNTYFGDISGNSDRKKDLNEIADAESKEKSNPSSHKDFQVIQIAERLMIKLASGRSTVFPYEIQILDKKSWERSQTGYASHFAYESRQIERVRRRLFGVNPNP
jgi:uncharacterized protein (TIGR04562 family)